MCYESNGGDRTWEEGFWWAYLTLFSHQRDVRVRVRVSVRERLIEGMEWVEVQEVTLLRRVETLQIQFVCVFDAQNGSEGLIVFFFLHSLAL